MISRWLSVTEGLSSQSEINRASRSAPEPLRDCLEGSGCDIVTTNSDGGRFMKHARMPRDEYFEEIVETLKSVPKRRLRLVRDVVGALAEPAIRDTN